MSTHNTDGVEYAKMSELKVGDKLYADGEFTCLEDGEECQVSEDHRGSLYVRCAEGQHTLDGQLSDVDDDHLVGFYSEKIT